MSRTFSFFIKKTGFMLSSLINCSFAVCSTAEVSGVDIAIAEAG
jgi:hypothetical protein